MATECGFEEQSKSQIVLVDPFILCFCDSRLQQQVHMERLPSTKFYLQCSTGDSSLNVNPKTKYFTSIQNTSHTISKYPKTQKNEKRKGSNWPLLNRNIADYFVIITANVAILITYKVYMYIVERFQFLNFTIKIQEITADHKQAMFPS